MLAIIEHMWGLFWLSLVLSSPVLYMLVQLLRIAAISLIDLWRDNADKPRKTSNPR